MTKTREIYICSSCGSQTMQWRGQCPNCHEWNTLQAAVQPKSAPSGNRPRQVMDPSSRPIPLRDVQDAGHEPYGSGLEALDRVLGKGLVPGAAILVGCPANKGRCFASGKAIISMHSATERRCPSADA